MVTGFVLALFGDPRTSTLEHRLFNTISLLNGIANLGGAIGLTASGSDYSQRWLHVVTGLLFLGCYYLSRFRNFYLPLYWPFVLLIVVFLFVNAVGNAGTLGAGHYYLIPALVIATILANNRRQVFAAAALFVAASAALLYVEIYHSELVMPYEHPEDRTFDVGGNLIFVELFTAALVLILTQNLNQERRKSDQLLLNILPETIAEELKRDDYVRPRAYDSATVLFTDCVGFTQIAEGLSAEGLISALDEVFTRFDAIVRAHGLEKIKTIGDAYMAVGGVPLANRTHAVDAVLAALEFRDAVDEIRARRSSAGLPAFQVRVGLRTGPLVAGVIGRSKFAYDVWGDTVNTASRMESSGESGRVNISDSTFALVSQLFECEPRGRIAAKHKGEIEMYFVNRIHPQYSSDSLGRTPNTAFYDLARPSTASLPRAHTLDLPPRVAR